MRTVEKTMEIMNKVSLKGKVKFRLQVKSDGIITSAEAAKSGGTEKAEWERHKRQKIKIVAGGS